VRIISLGIGDTTEPIPAPIAAAMEKARGRWLLSYRWLTLGLSGCWRPGHGDRLLRLRR